MFKAFGIILIAMLLSLYEYPKMKQKKQHKEIVVYLLILGMATTLLILKVLEISIPNPLKGIEYVFSPIGKKIVGQ